MTDLSAQRRLAADVLGVGKRRVWFDPDAQADIAEAITREDIRALVEDGVVRAEAPRGNSRGRARARNEKRSVGHRKGHGSRKGRAGAREGSKDRWTSDIRAQRRELRELRDAGEITPRQYRELYAKASGGEFRSVAYLHNYIEQRYGSEA